MKEEKVTRKVGLKGIRDLLLDRYSGDNKTELLPEQKMYLDKKDGLIMPSINILSFMTAENTKSAVKMNFSSKVSGQTGAAILGFVTIDPFEIPLTRKGKQIMWKGWGKNGITLREDVARLKKGVPNPKERPQIEAPWELEFDITIWKNDIVSELDVKNLFDKCGIPIGLGTYRGVFGKFVVGKWE